MVSLSDYADIAHAVLDICNYVRSLRKNYFDILAGNVQYQAPALVAQLRYVVAYLVEQVDGFVFQVCPLLEQF